MPSFSHFNESLVGGSIYSGASMLGGRPSSSSVYGIGTETRKQLTVNRLNTPSAVGPMLDMSYGLSMNVLNNSSHVI